MNYEYKIEPTVEQAETITRWLEICRGVWNHALAERKNWFNSRSCMIDRCNIRKEFIIPADVPRPTYASQCKALTAAKTNFPHLKEVNAQVLQQVLSQLEKAFVGMYESGRGLPRFKKAGRMRSFLFPQLGKNPVQGNILKLPVLGVVAMRLSRPIPDSLRGEAIGFELKQVRIIRKASGWFAMLTLQSDVDIPNAEPHGRAVGIDLGLLSFLATSDSKTITRPKFFVDLQRKLKLLQQRVSSKKLGSANWRKAQAKVARLHQRIADTRKDFHFKQAHELCNDAGMIFAEDLNLKAMSRGMLCKHTLDAGFGQFLNILKWVAFKRGVYFAKVDANYTSQICPECGTHTGKKDLSERVHHCPECGYTADRDVAAAQVIKARGLIAAEGHSVKKSDEGKVVALPTKQKGIPSYSACT